MRLAKGGADTAGRIIQAVKPLGHSNNTNFFHTALNHVRGGNEGKSTMEGSMLSYQEEQVIRNVINRLRCEDKSAVSGEVFSAMHNEPLRIWLESWVIPGLELMLPEKRDLKTAIGLTE